MNFKSAYYSIYFNEQWCYKSAYSSNPIDATVITQYINKVSNSGIYFNPIERVFFISSGIAQKKGETPSIRLNPDDLIIGDDNDDLAACYSKNYIVDYIYTDNDDYINALRADMNPLGSYIRDGKVVQRQVVLKTQQYLLSNIFNAKLTKAVCASVDALLNGNSVVLYGQKKGRKDFLDVIFYSLRCLPPKLANSVIINTNMKNAKIDGKPFIGCMTNYMHVDGAVPIDITDCENIRYTPNEFYTVYLEWLIENQGVLNFDGMESLGDSELLRYLNIMALNNLTFDTEAKPNKFEEGIKPNKKPERKENCAKLDKKEESEISETLFDRLKTIIGRMSNQKILAIIEDNQLRTQRRELIENLVRETDSLKYIYLCNETKRHENITGAQFTMSGAAAITEDDLREIEKFYTEYSSDDQAKEFLKQVFKCCILRIQSYDDNLFDLAYRLKIYLNVDICDMGYKFIDKVHSSFYESYQIKRNKKDDEEKSEKRNSQSNKKNKRWFLQSSAFTSAIFIVIPILIGIMLFLVPDKIWKYLAIIIGVNSWYIMPIVLGIVQILAGAAYFIPYMIMKNNTVHLNGFSNGYSTKVSCVCMLAVLIPMIIFVVWAATIS